MRNLSVVQDQTDNEPEQGSADSPPLETDFKGEATAADNSVQPAEINIETAKDSKATSEPDEADEADEAVDLSNHEAAGWDEDETNNTEIPHETSSFPDNKFNKRGLTITTIVALSVLGAASYLNSKSSTSLEQSAQNSTALENATLANIELSDEVGLLTARLAKVENSQGETSKDLDSLNSAFASMSASVDNLTTDLTAFEKKLQSGEGADGELREQLSDLKTALNGVDSKYATVIANLDRQALKKVGAVSAKSTPIRIKTLTKTRPVTTETPKPAPKLPFEVASIDRWGGSTQLAVSQGSVIKTLATNESFGGWTFASADRRQGVVVFKNAAGYQHIYSTESGRFQKPKIASAADKITTLSVLPTPSNARIRIMNIVPVYSEEISLAPGIYDIEVTAPGHTKHRQWIRIGEGHYDFPVKLTASNR